MNILSKLKLPLYSHTLLLIIKSSSFIIKQAWFEKKKNQIDPLKKRASPLGPKLNKFSIGWDLSGPAYEAMHKEREREMFFKLLKYNDLVLINIYDEML